MQQGSVQILRDFYDRNPYPKVPLFASAQVEQTFTLHYRAVVAACFGSAAPAVARPRILVAGCGTFEPYVVALANPEAEIVAVDLSSKALRKLKWRLWLHGLAHRVKLVEADLLNLPAELGCFHYMIASGVLHHLPDPLAGLRALEKRLEPFGVMRVMLYSRHGRESVRMLRDFARLMGVKSGRDLRTLVDQLPKSHPFQFAFHLYSDATNEVGLNDGFFHPSEHHFAAEEVEGLLAGAGMEATYFLHSSGGQSERFRELFRPRREISPWRQLAVLDRLNELESNFRFFAARRGDVQRAPRPEGPWEINPVLASLEGGRIYVAALDREVTVGPGPDAEQGLVAWRKGGAVWN